MRIINCVTAAACTTCLIVLAYSSRTTHLSNAMAAGPCDSPANEIVAENCRTGNPSTEWAVAGAGSSNIQGFATDISVNQGATVAFKVNAQGAAAFHLDIYRLGYYAGLGARKVATVAGAPQAQPACLTDSTVGLVECGNWVVNASWPVPPDATSGIYFARAVRDGGAAGASHIVFIVRDDVGRSDLLFQTSDTTWQAYNTYGGNSLYTGSAQSPPAGRAYKVSYNRPITTAADSQASWLFNAEYPMVRWIEANGYDVSYSTGVDSDRRGSELLEHKVFLSVGHDEYWSAAQRAAVEAARGAGVHLGFFSGNEVFWKTRWEASIDGTATPYRTLVSYKETHANGKIDPTAAWTGTWRDPRFSPPADGGRPENGLTGTIFRVNGTRSDTITVPAEFAAHRFWRNTSVASLLPGQTLPLIPATLGYEWDEDLDNGHRPAGLARLSSTTVVITGAEQQYLLDHGSTYGGGTATHSLTLYRHGSGALVFGAGTVQWPWGLDTNHDRGNPPPLPGFPGYAAFVQALHDMQQATMNLFTDMGVPPATPQADLAPGTPSSDTTRPSSTILSPAAGSLIQVGTAVVISGTAADGGGGIVAGVEVSPDNGTTWHPATGRDTWTFAWTPVTGGPAVLKSRAVDDTGNQEIPSAGVPVSLRRVCPCSLWSNQTNPAVASDPSSGAIELGLRFRADMNGYITGLRFYKGATNVGAHIGNLWTGTGTLLGSVPFTTETGSGWQEVRFATGVPVVGGATYVASSYAPNGHFSVDRPYFAAADFYNEPLRAPRDTVAEPNGVFKAGGGFPTDTFGSSNYWVDVVFETTAPVDNTPPTVSSVSPAANATGVSTTANVTATFSERVNPATITSTTVELRTAANALVAATVSYDDFTRTATLDPNGPLAASATYVATVKGGASGVKDVAGNPLAGDVTWSLTTGAGVVCPCTIWPDTATPAVAADQYPGPIELGVKWRTDVDGVVSGLRFYKGITNTGPHIGNLWTSTGTLLASVAFSGETASGWQQVALPTPVPVVANVTYVASYHTTTGHYAITQNQFAPAGVDTPPLHALANGVEGGNGVFLESATSGFPTQSFNSSNYWVDLVFSAPTGPDTTAPTVSSVTPAAGATGVAIGGNVTVTFSERVNPATITGTTIELRTATNALVAATVSYNDLTRTATLDPNGPLANSATYAATVKGGASGVKDVAGNPLAADVTWSFTTVAGAVCPCTIWPDTATPAVAADQHAGAIELGVKWRADVNGLVTGLRFYKGITNTGPHIGNLRTSTGALLASVTFSGETASGWQQVTLPTPVPVLANTTYVASYHTTTGHFAITQNYFTLAGVDAPPLHALASGFDGLNGVFIESPTTAFPTQSFNSSNYWVDVVFATASNNLPTISDVTDKSTAQNTVSGPHAVTVGDVETSAGSLTLGGASSNTTLVPNANIVFGGSGASRTVTITPAAGQSGTSTITMTVTDGNSGTATDSFVLTVTAVNATPTISDVPNQGITEDAATAALPVTVGDAETPPASLTLTGSSSNTALVPNANIVFGGSGASRTATVTPVSNQSGTTTITLTVSDGTGGTASDTFVLTVTAVNDAPTISDVANQGINEDAATGALAVTVGDVETPPASLTLTGSSSNTALVPNANIVVGGSGASRTATVTPVSNQSGTTTITLTVSDGTGGTASDTFLLTVTAVNDAPTISDVANQGINEDAATGALAVTVGDVETPPASLTLTGSSSNTALVPNANIVFGGSGASRTATVTPVSNQSGTTTITLTVSDGTGGTASDTFLLTVTAVNDAPTISDVANQGINEDAATGALAVTVGDVETPPASLTLTGSSSNTALVPNANIVFGGSGASRTATVTPVSNQSGTTTITLTVSDGTGGTASDTFLLTVTAVNDAPTISDVANQGINEDAGTGALAVTVGDVETPPASVTLTGSSSNPALVPNANIVVGGSGASRTATITPAANQSGTTTITLTVSDGTGGSATDTFLLTVTAINDAPTISDVTDKSTAQNTVSGPHAVTVGDVETAAAALTLGGASSNTTLVPNANIVFGGSGASRTATMTPAAGQSGTTTITLTVSDGTGGSATDTFVLTVTAVNATPTISDVPNQGINEDAATGALAVTVGDVETPPASLTLTGSSSNTALVPNANIVFGGSGASRTATVTPVSNQSGTTTITLTVSDGTGGTASDTFLLTVTAVNDAPTISDVANQGINEDAGTGALAVTVGDVETPPASVTLTGSSSNPALVPNANIVVGGSGASRTATITPAANQSGTTTITLTVSDGTGGSATDTFLLTVTAINDAPTISDVTDKSTAQNTVSGPHAVTVGDVETAAAALTLGGASSNTTLVPNANIVFGGSGASRTATMTPAAGQSGTTTITLTVSDGTGGSATDTFVLTVTAVNATPTISDVPNQGINEDAATGALAVTVGDVETPPASLTLTGSSSNTALVPNANIVFGGSGASRTATVTPVSNQSGTTTITLTVSDGTGGTASDTFLLTVTAVNDAPTISDVANQGINEDAATGALAVTVGDVETPPASLTLTGSSSNTALVPNANIVFGGGGASRTATVTPVSNQSGTTTITLTVSDGTGGSAVDTFLLTVTAINDAPTISDVTDKSTAQNTVSGPHAVTVGDVETAAAALTLGGASSNTTLVPNANIVFGGSGASRTVTITPAAGQSGSATITMTVSDGTGGTATDSFVLTVTAVNTAPTISDVATQTTNEDTATAALGVTVGDLETPPASLTLTGSSSNTTLVPNANIVFGGSGSSRTVTIAPALNQSGSATITMTVADGSGGTANDTFLLTVLPVNDAPTISNVTDKTTSQDTVSGPHTLTIGDVETAAAALTVAATSSNTVLVPTANIVFAGTGANRTATITPALNQSGTTTITLTVTDAAAGTAADTFVLTVTANRIPVVVAAYGFEEGSGTSVADASGGPHTGSITGATWSAAGRFGRALAFDGNDWVTVPDASALRLSSGMTLEAWVKPAANPPDWSTVILKERTAGLAYALYADTSTQQRPEGSINTGGSDVAAAGGTRLPLDTWTHLATTYDGAQLRVYINGVHVGSQTVSGSIVAGAGPLRFGGNAVWGEYFIGLLDEIRLYDGARTLAEIQSDMDTPVQAANAPTLSDVTDKTTAEDTATPALGFTVGDVETPAASLTVAGSSSNPALVPNANIVFGGSGASRTVTITPAPNQFGTATITLTVTDGNSATASDTFVLAVTPVNDAPTISDTTDKTTPQSTVSGPHPFTVGDVETAAAALTITGASSNTTLVPVANIVFGGSGLSRTVTITPASNQTGAATITLTVADGTGTAADSFVVTVTAGNAAPTISDVTDKATNEDTTTAALAVTIGDLETPAASLTFAASSSNPALVPNGNLVSGGSGSSRTVTITPTPNQSGATTITLTVTDGNGGSASDTFVLTVTPVNDPPAVNAGPDQSVVFPASASLAGTVVDIDGPALVRVWSQVSGPGTTAFADPNAAATTATFSAPGTYVLRLAANDGDFTPIDDVSVTANGGNMALRLDGVSKRVTFGPAPGLGAATFTIETWFKREGPGVTVSTGTGGLPAAIPLVTKGRGEADGSNLDMNYFLGIDGATRVLAADFEDTATGLNHPVWGVTPICDNVWYHAAATYDGTTWRLYLNGQLETTLVVGSLTPRSDSIQHAGLGAAFTSTGTASGAFHGELDEPRVWNVARNAAAIQATMTGPLTSAAGLVGRWSVDEGSGSAIADSTGGGNTGTIQNTAVWVTGTPYVSTPLPPGSYGLRLTGSATDAGHVKLGAAPGLGAATFTIETWFKREAAGVATNTGASGVIAVPLVTKGMAETEGGTVDMNYFLGIREADNLLVADFEDTATGLNHPVAGVTPIPVDGVWHHAAATYDGTTWRLYLDGALQTQLVVGAFTPQFNSIQHAAIGSALNSTGGIGSQTQGFFGGTLDEVRIWNVARSGAQILAGRDQEIPSATGLLGRWGFNDSCGGVLDSSGNANNGTLSGANCTFVAGAPFVSTPNTAPVVNAGPDQPVALPAAAALSGTATDDGVPGIGLTTTWSKSIGPGTVTFGNVSALTTTAGFSVAGTYVLRLTASDGLLSSVDELTITVTGVVNQAPVVNAGVDQAIALPINQVSLTGIATDDGLPSATLTTTWSQVSGPGTVTFGNVSVPSTTATFSLQGTYVLQLAAGDGLLSASDTLSVTVSPNPADGSAVDFGGTNAYVTFGAAPGLGVSTLTIETWFRRDGAGIATNTGTGGVVAVPLVAKGMAEAEGGTVDMNYFLGIRSSDGVLVADFEDTATGLNHPVAGTTAIPSDGAWRHAAATYDGTAWRLYLDGVLQAQLVVGAFTPQFNSIQHATLGTALNSTGGIGTQTQGFLNGALDEARVWNYARSAQQISRGRQLEIAAAPGLKGRWSFSETTGTTIADSSGNNVSGTLVGTNWTRIPGAPFTPPGNMAPVATTDAASTNRNTPATIAVLANDADADADTLSVTAVTAPAHGTAVANANGTVLYTPAAGYEGGDSFVYTISDNQGGSASGTVSVTIAGNPNLAPVVNAGLDQAVTLPINVASLAGTATDDGVPGTGLTTAWSKVSGPGTVTFGSAAALATTATFSMQGSYVLRLTVSDSLLSAGDTLTVTVNPNAANKALDLGGTNAYVTFGAAPGLGVSTLTLETWFRRDGAGIATNTGSGGVVAIPLVTKGMAETEGGTVDMNYFLGIRSSDSVLVADFEDAATGLNHPVAGTTAILANGVWRHAAATYDGTTWRLYLDGALQAQLVVGAFTPQSSSIQHAALGTALNSTGGVGSQTQGFFDGVMDEARVWNYARSAQQIGRGAQLEIASAPGLRGRWGFSEGSGSATADSSGNNVGGTLVGSNVTWVAGAPFAGSNATPAAVTDAATTPESTPVAIAVLVNDTDADGDSLRLTAAGTPAHGTASVNPNGTVTYTPVAGYNGSDSFTYSISDNQGGSATATVNVTISSVNVAPVAVNDSYSITRNTTLTVDVPGLLLNDTDADGDPLMAIALSGTTHGTLTLGADGDLIYTPEIGYTGLDSFTYFADDGLAGSNIATVTITIMQ